MSVDAKLLPCPFCGSAVISRSKDGEYHVIQCAQCGCEMANTIRYKLDSAWNRRTPHPAPVTAREAEPVAWQVRYHSRWIMAPSCWTDEDRANWPGEHRALYAHPPQPSETVAEASRLLTEIVDQCDLMATGRTWRIDAIKRRAVAALRALKGADQ